MPVEWVSVEAITKVLDKFNFYINCVETIHTFFCLLGHIAIDKLQKELWLIQPVKNRFHDCQGRNPPTINKLIAKNLMKRTNYT